jgi:hypothetical protein
LAVSIYCCELLLHPVSSALTFRSTSPYKHLSLLNLSPSIFSNSPSPFHPNNKLHDAHLPLLRSPCHRHPCRRIHPDVFVAEATSDSHAIQAVIGQVKVCIGDNGSAPCQATALSISPNDATVNLTTVYCTAYSDTGAAYPIGAFGVYDELGFGAVTAVGSVLCETY